MPKLISDQAEQEKLITKTNNSEKATTSKIDNNFSRFIFGKKKILK